MAAVALGLYERAVRAGLLKHPLSRRLFEVVYLTYKRVLEAGPVGSLREHVPPGSTVIDAGANVGFFTLRFARWVGPGGRVIAIEPEQVNVESLERRVRQAGLGSVVECVRAAAADRAGELKLALNPLHPGDHHIAESGEPVRAVTLDGLVAGDARPVSLLKIDVQGAEAMVLDGARELIASHRPVIFMELDAAALERFGSSPRELLERLVGLGYAGHALTRAGAGPAAPANQLAAEASRSYLDVLFLPDRAGVRAGTPAAG